LDNQLEQFVKNENLQMENQGIEVETVEEDDQQPNPLLRKQSYEKSRRSLSMIQPS
jgi:hypothetical protein